MSIPETNAGVIAVFRANRGEVPAPYPDPPPMVILHTTGARSGRPHLVPMRALPEGETLIVFATAHSSPRHPDWYYNVLAHPEIVVEHGTSRTVMHATELTGTARKQAVAAWISRVPPVATILARTPRQVPAIRLTPVPVPAPDPAGAAPSGPELA